MRSQYIATALLVSCGFSVCASAETTQYANVVADPEIPAKVVSFSDLNLHRDEGVAVLYRRIQVAAKKVCAESNERMPRVKQRARACTMESTSRAVAQVGIPALSTLHASRTGKSATDPVRVAREAR